MASELEERRVEVADLELGMFVSRLDVPWELTDFPLQGVQLTSSEDIAKLRELCEFVYVDARRQVMPDTPSQILQRTELSASRFEARLGYSDQVPFGGGTYTLAYVEGNSVPVAGIMACAPDQPGANDWFAYINVDDIDASVEAVTAAGGMVMREPFEVEGTGWIAIVMDSARTAIGLLEPAPMN